MPTDLRLSLNCSALGHVEAASASVYESLSAPTRAIVHFVAEAPIDTESPVGAKATLTALVDGAPSRTWALLVMSLRHESIRGEKLRYAVELANPLELLRYQSDIRINQNLTAQAIVSSVLTRSGVGLAPTWKLTRTLPVRVYCVQYRETHFDFVSRLLEHDGIFYICNDGDSGDGLTLADSASAFAPIAGASELQLVEGGRQGGVQDLEVEYAWTTDQVALRDWNFMFPSTPLDGVATVGKVVDGATFEFPGSFSSMADGAALATIRGERLGACWQIARGRSDELALRPGRTFPLVGASRESLNTTWLVREVVHTFEILTLESSTKEESYRNSFVGSPSAQPYRPPRRAPMPVAPGSDCVVVTGPAGQEIDTDTYGRLTAKFYWDRVGPSDQTSSMAIRFAQLPIGGSMALARVGWEMVVRYLYGDPDRPIAVARVDNAVHTSPYAYPAAKTAMSFKTLSSPGGGAFNELTMEDGSGGMKYGVTAAKDYFEQVNNDKTQTVTVNETLDVGVDHTNTVGGNQTVTIGAMHTKSVSSDAGVNVTGSRTKAVGAAEMVTVSGALKESVAANDTESVGACRISAAATGVTRTSKGSSSLTVGGAMIEAAVMGCAVSTAGARSETVGALKLSASGGLVGENVVGALAQTVGGVMLSAAGGKSVGSAKGSYSVTVGGLAMVNAASKVTLKAKTVKITVGGVANLLGGGGILNLTPGSAAFVGLVTLDGSNGVSLSGAPNLVG